MWGARTRDRRTHGVKSTCPALDGLRYRGVGGYNLIPVAVARDIRQVIPVAGSFVGMTDDFSDDVSGSPRHSHDVARLGNRSAR